MKKLIFITLLITSLNSFSQTTVYNEFYNENTKYSKVDFSKVIHTVETEKHVYFFYDTTFWKAKEILLQSFAIATPFLIDRFIVSIKNPNTFLLIEAPIVIGSIIYTKIHIRKNRYIRIKK